MRVTGIWGEKRRSRPLSGRITDRAECESCHQHPFPTPILIEALRVCLARGEVWKVEDASGDVAREMRFMYPVSRGKQV
jgi:hypothetical protein